MMRIIGGIAVGLLLLGSSGCAYIGPSAEAKEWERYREYAPKFTDEEKQNMTVEEKLAIYNAHVVEREKLTCSYERVTGSHIKVARCFTANELHEQREAAREFLLSARRGESF